MKRIDWGVVLGVIGAFLLLLLLFVFHPFSCVSSAKTSALAPQPDRPVPGTNRRA